MMRLNEALQPGDDLVIWDRQRVDIEAEKARQHLTEIQQLKGKTDIYRLVKRNLRY